MIVASACGDKSYELSRTDNGLQYHFFKSDLGAKTGNNGDVYHLNLSIANKNDSIIVQQNLKFERNFSIYPGDFHEGLSLLRKGDSVLFVVSADSFFSHHGMPLPISIKAGEEVHLFIGCIDILNPIQHMIKMNEDELVQMESFVKRKGWTVNTDSTGIKWELIQVRASEGPKIEWNDSVEISYLYYTLNERIIQQSKPNDYWKFHVGDPNRINGLSRVLSFMSEGQKVRAILPFEQAFGENGMGAIVPPFTTIVLEIEAHKVHKPKK
jgi:hypothetical protein